MRSALYYPDTEISSVDLLKNALLMWDELEYLVPWADFVPTYSDPQFAEAISIIGKPHVPTREEQQQAHALIQDLLTRPLPASFLFRSVGNGQALYEMYPEKFIKETWGLLHDAKLAGQPLPDADYPVSEFTGLSLMALLADCCAGETRRRVTDQIQAYAGLTSVFTSHADHESPEDSPERLIPMTLKTISIEGITLKKLIEFRKREASQGGHSIRDLRRRYVEKLENHVKDAAGQSARDRAERDRQFAEDMEDDLAELREEMRIEAAQTVFSKEILIAVLAGVGAEVSWVTPQAAIFPEAITASGAPASIGGLIAAGNKFMSARRSLTKKHPMSYLYELKGGLRL